MTDQRIERAALRICDVIGGTDMETFLCAVMPGDERWRLAVAIASAFADQERTPADDVVERLLRFARGGPMTWRREGAGGAATDYNALRADILAALSTPIVEK